MFDKTIGWSCHQHSCAGGVTQLIVVPWDVSTAIGRSRGLYCSRLSNWICPSRILSSVFRTTVCVALSALRLILGSLEAFSSPFVPC